MKREGRQHGMVRTFQILPSPFDERSESRFVNKLDSPLTVELFTKTLQKPINHSKSRSVNKLNSIPTAGLFTKVSQKPTNHSKFTGKCIKAKCNGCHIHPACKSRDKAKGTQKLKSRDMITNHKLINWRVVDWQPGLNSSGLSVTETLNHLSSDYIDNDASYDVQARDDLNFRCLDLEELERGVDNDKNEYDCNDFDNMGFCDVGFILDQVEGDQGWCLVTEM
ncbi:hypothetical protein CFOL_v3_31686 [Cephalotus follicularis]|uniref:Uncharacterized protein n=1 Tax=Cephalotus follicularis TaxID=3775 RepID=A0A1Q3D7G6_CEPFO|nr:hypothetical protein CFOL_v3_31686 [Cephalotus follicularis]